MKKIKSIIDIKEEKLEENKKHLLNILEIVKKDIEDGLFEDIVILGKHNYNDLVNVDIIHSMNNIVEVIGVLEIGKNVIFENKDVFE